MKKSKIFIMLICFLSLFVSCSNTGTSSSGTSSKTKNPTVQSILKSNPDADLFIMNNTVFINAKDIDWVTKLSLKKGKVLGKITKTDVRKDFKDRYATKLDVDTVIYEAEERNDILLLNEDGKLIPYLKLVEG